MITACMYVWAVVIIEKMFTAWACLARGVIFEED
jgi:hypothetical protein